MQFLTSNPPASFLKKKLFTVNYIWINKTDVQIYKEKENSYRRYFKKWRLYHNFFITNYTNELQYWREKPFLVHFSLFPTNFIFIFFSIYWKIKMSILLSTSRWGRGLSVKAKAHNGGPTPGAWAWACGPIMEHSSPIPFSSFVTIPFNRANRYTADAI